MPSALAVNGWSPCSTKNSAAVQSAVSTPGVPVGLEPQVDAVQPQQMELPSSASSGDPTVSPGPAPAPASAGSQYTTVRLNRARLSLEPGWILNYLEHGGVTRSESAR